MQKEVLELTFQLILEAVLLLHVLICIKALVHIVNKKFKKEVINRKVLMLFYIYIFYNYCDMNETIVRRKLDEYEFIIQHKNVQKEISEEGPYIIPKHPSGS